MMLLHDPLIITAAEGSQKLVLDYSPELKNLQRDMPLQQALSLQAAAELIHADIPYYCSVFNGILDALEKRSPLVEGTDLGDIYIGLDGMQLIYENDDVLVKAIRAAVPLFLIRISVSPRINSPLIWRPGTVRPAVTKHSPETSQLSSMTDLRPFAGFAQEQGKTAQLRLA